ncbi:amino acid adenylation domain-containing protein (plasmid) [Cylindrospermum sp. NIES-4074]|nr:amino acid adenylation domain-containing protein [Cylindrospermum sp. NIES-4074]
MLDIINVYAHGFVAVPVIIACKKKGLFQLFKKQKFLTLEQITYSLNANSGHLQVALRMMHSLDWLSQNHLGEYSLTDKAEICNTIDENILELYHLPIDLYLLGKENPEVLRDWIERSRERWHIKNTLIASFLDGVLIIPILLALKKNKLLTDNQEKDIFSKLKFSVKEELCNLFLNKEWVKLKEETFSLTDAGKFIWEGALNLGTVASYTPMLSQIDDVLFGDCQAVFSRDTTGHEKHIDRTLNVVASGFQHQKYFADVDEVILSIFNKLPFAEQPKYVADMGCGDGTFLKRVYTIIRDKSARGKVLNQYPLYMIGIDYNQASLRATENTLAGIPHLIIKGDIGAPEQLLVDLREYQIYDPENILHIRSFLDHDRPFIHPQKLDKVEARTNIPYQGVYVDGNGHLIPPAVMVQSLVEHFDRWSSVTTKHGLIILEVHCLEPNLVYKFLDKSENLHFDAYQAFSMQHLIEANVFLMAAAEVGLFPNFKFFKRYPKTFPFTRITLNIFEKKAYKIRHPLLKDLPGLINLEAKCWPEHLRTSADIIQQRIELFPNGHCLLEMDEQIIGVIYSQKISSINLLENVTCQNILSLHTDEGSIIQLLGLSILPEMQNQGLGDHLRDFMLQWCTLKGGITKIVGITRCKSYANHLHMPMEEYILQRNSRGQLVDPILRFHEEGGAKIKKILPNYRPEDVENLGIGILIEYDTNNLQSSNLNSRDRVEGKYNRSQQSESENLNTIIYESIRTVIGERRMKDYAVKRPLMEMGLDSLELLELRTLLSEHVGIRLEPTFFFQYGTPESIIHYFQNGEAMAGDNATASYFSFVPDETKISGNSDTDLLEINLKPQEAIAIIGMACRFPGHANSPEEYWSILRNGIDTITEVPKNRWNIEQYYYGSHQSQGNKISSKYGGFLDRIDQFDAQFFRISRREAIYTDPQQRILLEETWNALENAGIAPESLAGTQTGVFVGIFSHDYELLQVKQNQEEQFETYFGTGNASSIAAGRLSYFFGFTGPAIAVDTACSSSLVAVHLACQSLRNGECDLALASGINLLLSPELSITFSKSGMLSPDGRCKTFDASANGYVRSEGCGVIVLKNLSQAIADNDNIFAVVRGTAINQDGASNGLTAPNKPSQEAVIRKALSVAGVLPHEVSYVEAHGTATSLGDPVEITALESVYGEGRTAENPLIISSVKTNIGHTEAAAGIAGLIKVVLSMQNQYIPPHLHFQELNRYINLDEIPAIIPVEGRIWKPAFKGNRRLAGVSSFGFSGTNAHVVLEEAPVVKQQTVKVKRTRQILTLSAKSDTALRQLAKSYADFLGNCAETSLANICYTANTGRSHFEYRLAVIAESATQLREQLDAFAINKEAVELLQGSIGETTPKIAFLFTGQGSQYVGMGRELYQTQPAFRTALNYCEQILRPELQISLLDVLYPSAGKTSLIDNTAYTQPALFALEYSLYQLWTSWGIQPHAVMGHSVGEYVAACVAGVFSLEDALKLIVRRGQLMQELPVGGEMVSLIASEKQVRQIIAPLHDKVAIAAINGPENVVISGVSKYISAISRKLEAQGIKTKRLQVSHAFHSPLMTPMLAEFEQVANHLTYKQPQIPLVSNVTGKLSDHNIATAQYWINHIHQTVQFASSMQTLDQQGYEVFLEIGPKPILLGMGRQCLLDKEGLWLPSLREGISEWQQLLSSLSKLYIAGAKVDWSAFERDYVHQKISLPTYPFQRQRYWIQQVNIIMNEKDLAVNGNKNGNKLEAEVGAAPRTSRREEIIATLQALVGNLLQVSPTDVKIYAPFLELGADSFILVEAVRRIENTYGIKIAIRQLFEELATLDTLANYVEQHLAAVCPASSIFTTPQVPQEPIQLASQTFVEPQILIPQEKQVEATVSTTILERIMSQQLQLMSKQLDVLQNKGIGQQQAVVVENGKPVNAHILPQSVPPAPQIPTSRKSQTATPDNQTAPAQVSSPWEPKKPPILGLTPQQQNHLEALIHRYTQRTQTSKKLVQTYRPVLADSRASVGFRLSIKEMLYPIIAQRSQGSRVWDVDGNEYIDMTMGQGVTFFGHQPPFIMEALEEQLKQGIHLNPRSPVVGEVAELICELTGVERVCFCNSGTEAVMAAIRVARAVTGRTKIALFDGSYHGHADGTLIRQQIIDNERRSFPLALGVPSGVVEDVVVLEYCSSQSLEFLQVHAHELAAVLVEPVQSSRPMLQSRDFLHNLRQITAQAGTALIFDEMITGFRTHPGGAQAWFGVLADIVTYGKVVAGGLPIGVVAGKRLYLDSVDGGMWSYGDNSYPQVERTFFGGTFCQHPLAMVAARSVLKHLKEQGPGLQQQLNERTSKLATTLNTYFRENEVPIEIEHFSSFFRFALTGNLDLLFYHMLEKGIYVWEWRKHFLSTAHTQADIAQFIQVVKDSVEDLRQGGFLPPKKFLMPSQPSHEGDYNTITPVNLADKTQVKGFWQRHRSAPSTLKFKASSNHQKPLQFSLYYFGSYKAEFSTNKYNLLFEGAKFGDNHGFTAIWIPERHFHSFGGFSPNPSVIAAALARETQQIQLRSGSVVLPLHHPIRVAEEWAVVDNISQGRVGISFASGWHSHDFVLAPQSFGKHRELMFQEIETVQKLWQGESVTVLDGNGKEIRVKTYPMPMQSKLPIWITIVNNPDTYIRAGEIGAGILTNLMGQTIEDLARNIVLYRESLAKHGYPPESATVTVLLHTFVGNDLEQTREQAKQPFCNYLKSSIELLQNMLKIQGLQVDFGQLTEEDQNFILLSAYQRYVQTSALIGTPTSCRQVIDNLRAVGVDEIACLIDFGVDENAVLNNLPYLNDLKEYYQQLEENNVLRASSDITENIIYDDKLPYENGKTKCSNLIPLTQAQKQLWILAQMGEDSSLAYNESVTLQLQGLLNPTAMGKAIEKLVDRHEALRTKISPNGDVQEILPTLKVDCPVLDFSCVEDDRQTQIAEWFNKESQKPFDLIHGPLLRVNLLKLESELYLLVLSAHHIVIDGWSIGVMLRELGALYSAESQGMVCHLNSPKQFWEYIDWQNQQNQTQEMKIHESYWLQKLTLPPVLDLPTDRMRPSIKTYHANWKAIKLDAQVSNNLKVFSRQQGCTLLMTLLSVYMTLIHRFTGQDDIIVGVPTSGRSFLGSQDIVGYCTHLLPIRSKLLGNPTFVEYLQQMRTSLLEAYEHQDYPFAQLLDQLNLPREISRSPLVDVTFNLEPPITLQQMPQLETSLLPQAVSFKDRDLHLNVTEIADNLSLEFNYNTDLFDADTIERWLSHLQTLLQVIITEPKQHLRELPLLTASEQQQLLVDWNNTQTDYPNNTCIHHLFELQVEKTPNAVAVIFENQQLTYQQLNHHVNQLAHYLQSLGVKPETPVGICVERSLEMIIALLGILKAGGAYVPLDPAYPPERLAYMLLDAKIPLLLTQGNLVTRLPKHPAQMVCLDREWKAISKECDENPFSGVKPENLAYIIYTSGSTGKPKGVMLVHQGLCNLTMAHIKIFDVQPCSRILQFASLSFDASIWEIFMALCAGATLCLGTSDSLLPGSNLMMLLRNQSITHVILPPSSLAVLPAEESPALQTIVVGGEACFVDLVAKWSQGRRFFNAYGPTESTVCVTVAECSDESKKPVIGRPIANTQIYILDSHLQLVPIGVPGELHVGGVALARGYLNDPKLTKEKFIPNPFFNSKFTFENSKSNRLYKTGDLARYLPDGNIEFLGRLDNQVKIRGFRIELGEIEAAIAQHPSVQQTVVTARVDDSPEKRLVAYIVPNPEQTLTPDELRHLIKKKLPEYMMPSAFVFLNSLPLTPNGKIDRNALPSLNSARPNLEETFVAPRTDIEQQIADIWTYLLKLEKVGIHDNFFTLGGHSLLATQVMSRIYSTFGLDLSVRILFEAPTIAELADRIETFQWVTEQSQTDTMGNYKEGEL